jgi:hypothetical protein
MGKPTIFIGCSSERSDLADAVHAKLERCSEPIIWKDGVFGIPGQGAAP